ncbi:MAG: VPLPA-CTERM sorting domain-containing protein [Litoreibacter sp.]|nr:VPLPA-CTERM sorting domain-containing protein [Litoreibacter sp.]
MSSPVSAATLNVDPNGQLMGASNVEIDGSFFDVVFVDGSCVSVFSGCDDASDFIAFSNSPALALLEQVFLDRPFGQFDSAPELINGITDESSATVLIVNAPPAPGSDTIFDFAFALNNSGNDTDFAVTGSILPVNADTTFIADTTFARFTPSISPPAPVPLPAAAWFMLAGLGALGAVRRSNRSNGVSST